MNDTSPRTTVVPLAESPATEIQRHIESTGAFQVTLATRGTLKMEFTPVTKAGIDNSYEKFMELAHDSGARDRGRNFSKGNFYANVHHNY